MKKIAALISAFLMLTSFVGCADKDSSSDSKKGSDKSSTQDKDDNDKDSDEDEDKSDKDSDEDEKKDDKSDKDSDEDEKKDDKSDKDSDEDEEKDDKSDKDSDEDEDNDDKSDKDEDEDDKSYRDFDKDEDDDSDSMIDTNFSFDGLTVVDNEQCYIKVTDIGYDDFWEEMSFDVELENRTSDKNYTFSIMEASVNGVVTTAFLNEDVGPGKKANDSVQLLSDESMQDAFTTYSDIELKFRVYDADDWMADDVLVETVHIYPYGEDKAEKYEYQVKDSDKVILDNESCTVIVTGFENDDIWGYMTNLYIVNKTSDKHLMLSVDNSSVNDNMVDTFFADDVPAGKSSFTSISFDNDDLDEAGITDIEEIQFDLRVYDFENIFGDDVFEGTITLNP